MAQAAPRSLDFAEALSNKMASSGYEFSVIAGRVYDKIVQGRTGQTGQSVHAFVERKTGRLIKAAGWNAPQKDKDGPAYRYDLSDPVGFAQAMEAADAYGSYLYKN